MVNVPGRSKGCNTCRKRKKGESSQHFIDWGRTNGAQCDLRKPTCQRCDKDGYTCTGYSRTTIWVKYEPGDADKPNVRASSFDETKTRLQRSPASIDHNRVRHAFNSSALSNDLIKGQMELDVLDHFMQAYMPLSATSSTPRSTLPWPGGWKKTITAMSAEHLLVRRTIAALALSYLGQQGANEAMAKQGTKLYGAVLRQLNEHVRQPKTNNFHCHVVAAIHLMGLYEQFGAFSSSTISNQSRNWQAHVQGMTKLFELQGPEAFADEQAFCIFQACQYSQFTSAWAGVRSSPLAAPDWRSIPWTGRRKSARDLFFDIIFPLSTLASRADADMAFKVEDRINIHLRSCYHGLLKLEAWKTALDRNEDPGLWHLLFTVDEMRDSSRCSLKENEYEIADVQTALLFCSINMHLIILINRLTSCISGRKSTTLAIDISNALPFVLWILQAIPICVQDGSIFGSQAVLYPMGGVQFFIKFCKEARPDLAAQASELLIRVSKELHYMEYMGGFLNNIQTIKPDCRRYKDERENAQR